MSLPNEKYLAQSGQQQIEKEKLKSEIARLQATTSSVRGRRLLELSARILDTDAPLLELDEINEALGREYPYE